MKRILILALLFTLSLITFVTAQEAVNNSAVSRKLDSFLQMATKLSQFNGSVLVSYQGAVLLDKGYGFKNVTDKIPNNTQKYGSITKSVSG